MGLERKAEGRSQDGSSQNPIGAGETSKGLRQDE